MAKKTRTNRSKRRRGARKNRLLIGVRLSMVRERFGNFLMRGTDKGIFIF